MNKWLIVSGGVAAAAILVGFSVVRHNTDDIIGLQKDLELRSELQTLNDFSAWINTQQQAPDPTIARVFLSKGIIDALLGSFAGMVVPLPGAEEVKLTVKEIKADFRPGFPGLAISASVEKSGVKVEVATLARIDPRLNDGVLKMRVHVDSIVPKVSWRFIDFTVGGLVRDMAQTRLTEEINKSEALGSISVPITQSSSINAPAGQIPFMVTGVQGTVSLPAYSASGTMTVSRVLAMPEGIYVYANLKKEG